MHTPEEHESHNKPASLREGYEVTDVSVRGIMVFLTGLFISVGVFFVFCFGLGILINNGLKKSRWRAEQVERKFRGPGGQAEEHGVEPCGGAAAAAAIDADLSDAALQGDDGNQDLVDLHAREDLLLDHYSWVDQSQGKVRIPIERAMELIAQRGLPVAAQPASSGPLMAGDSKPAVQSPLTDGFARTGYEQQEMSPAREAGEQASTKANNN